MTAEQADRPPRGEATRVTPPPLRGLGPCPADKSQRGAQPLFQNWPAELILATSSAWDGAVDVDSETRVSCSSLYLPPKSS